MSACQLELLRRYGTIEGSLMKTIWHLESVLPQQGSQVIRITSPMKALSLRTKWKESVLKYTYSVRKENSRRALRTESTRCTWTMKRAKSSTCYTGMVTTIISRVAIFVLKTMNISTDLTTRIKIERSGSSLPKALRNRGLRWLNEHF